jgi:hypothetical protein
VNLYDALGVQGDTEKWPIEADWTADGARYISTKTDTRFQQLNGATPDCFKARMSPSNVGNTANFTTGTLLMSELSGL